MRAEAAEHADFSILRYGQCWEDADVLLDALDIGPGEECLSIASAGDNTLSMLARCPARVVAVDLNPTQLHALEVRIAAFRTLSHDALLELMGSRPSARRSALYGRCRPALPRAAREYWDRRGDAVERGIGSAGRFERYLAIFRERLLPFVHRRSTVRALLAPRAHRERVRFYEERWESRRWRALFSTFFSNFVLGRLGRDPAFFRYAERSVGDHLRARVRHALVELEPWTNPYLHWILIGEHGEALPHALRAENFDVIRANLDRMEVHCRPLEDLVAAGALTGIDRLNLSNVFEYMSPTAHRALLEALLDVTRPGARMAYWNMVVPRRGVDACPGAVRPLDALARRLFAKDKAFFYSAFHLDEAQ